MKIGIVTGHNPPCEYKDINTKNLTEYCNRYGYTLITYYEQYECGRNPWWNKHKIVKELLPLYDYLLWFDSDAIVTNMTKPLTDIIDNDHDIFITEDTDAIQACVMLFHNSSWTFEFLDQWWSLGDEKHEFWIDKKPSAIHNDNTILEELLDRDSSIKSHFRLLSPKEFVVKHVHFPGNPGSFIMHVPGSPEDEKLYYMQLFSQNIIR